MALFGKKADEKNAQPGGAQSEAPRIFAADVNVKILGSGCDKCNELEANTKAALGQLGIKASMDHVTDFAEIAKYGVMSTPALVVNGKVVSYGKVLKTADVAKLLQKVLG